MSEQASLSKDVVGGILASPLSFVRTCWRVLVQPSRYFEPIALGDKRALQRAFSFFAVAAAGSIAAHFSMLKFSGMGMEMPAEVAGSGLFNQIMQNDWIYKIVVSLLAITFCALWYAALRGKAVRDKITAVKFLHAVLPPAGALLVANVVLGAVMIGFTVLAPVSTDMSLITDPAARHMTAIFCKAPGSYMCRNLLIQQQYPLTTFAFFALSAITLLWFGYIVSSILKSKTGISHRRTMFAYVAAFVAFCFLLATVIGFYLAAQQA